MLQPHEEVSMRIVHVPLYGSQDTCNTNAHLLCSEITFKSSEFVTLVTNG